MALSEKMILNISAFISPLAICLCAFSIALFSKIQSPRNDGAAGHE